MPGEHFKVRTFLTVRAFNPWPSLPEGDGESPPKGAIFPNHTYFFKYNFMGLQDGSGGKKVYGLLSRWFDPSGKTLSLGFPSLFCYVTPEQVPGITVNCIEKYSSPTCFGSQKNEIRKVIDIYYMNVADHGI